MMRYLVAVLIVLWTVWGMPATAQNLEYVGSAFWTGLNDVKVVDGVAYCAFVNGLEILDVNDPAAPFYYSKVFCQGEGLRIDVSGQHAYLADGSSGLQIIDISNKQNPQLVGHCDMPDIACAIAVSGDYAYVVCDASGLQIVDISSPSDPEIVGSASMPDNLRAGEIAVSGDYAYIGTHYNDGFLLIYNIADATEPQLLGSLRICIMGSQSHGVTGIIVTGTVTFVSASASGDRLFMIDTSDPLSPFVLQSAHGYGNFLDIDVSGNHAYLLSSDELSSYAIDDSAGFKWEDRHFFRHDTYPINAVYLANGLAYVAGGTALEIVDISNPDSLLFGGAYDSRFLAREIDVNADYAYIPSSRNLQIVDLHDPSAPTPLDSCILPAAASRVYASGNYAYVTCTNIGLQIVDVSDPDSSFIAGSYLPQSQTASIVSVLGNYAYLMTGLGLEIVNIEDPANPALVGQYWRLGKAFIAGSYAYMMVTPSNEFHVIYIGDPGNPTLVGNIALDGARAVFVQGDYAYLTHSPGLLIIDVSDPNSPRVAGSCSTQVMPYDIHVEGDYAYLAILGTAHHTGGVEVVDVRDAENPVSIGSYYLPNYSFALDMVGDHIYLVTENSMVVLSSNMVGIDDSDIVPGAFGILQNYPNPFNGSTSISYSIKSRGHVTISMYNIVGQRIGTLFDGETEAGEHKMTWDARTFPSGVYFARLESGGRRETIKMVVLK